MHTRTQAWRGSMYKGAITIMINEQLIGDDKFESHKDMENTIS